MLELTVDLNNVDRDGRVRVRVPRFAWFGQDVVLVDGEDRVTGRIAAIDKESRQALVEVGA